MFERTTNKLRFYLYYFPHNVRRNRKYSYHKKVDMEISQEIHASGLLKQDLTVFGTLHLSSSSFASYCYYYSRVFIKSGKKYRTKVIQLLPDSSTLLFTSFV